MIQGRGNGFNFRSDQIECFQVLSESSGSVERKDSGPAMPLVGHVALSSLRKQRNASHQAKQGLPQRTRVNFRDKHVPEFNWNILNFLPASLSYYTRQRLLFERRSLVAFWRLG